MLQVTNVIRSGFLIIKERFPPLPLLALDACISRLPEGHPKLTFLRQEAAKYQKGFNGERKLDYYLRSLDNDFSILNDITLSVNGIQFQIDSLIVTSVAIYIIEVKSLDGIVRFDTGLKQLTQSNGEILIGRKYPITQVENIAFLLMRWLQQKKLNGLSIYYFIAIADHHTVIQVTGEEKLVTKVVTYADEIPMRVMKTNEKLKQLKAENRALRNRVVQTMMQNREELNIEMLSKAGIDKNDIIPGVHCENCNKLGMIRKRYKWYCSNCRYHSYTAHKKALLDYALIFDREITNQSCQQFLQISRQTAYTILKITNGVELAPNKRKWLLDVERLRS